MSASLPQDIGIVYFGNDFGAENRTSSHHIAERLARDHTLLYVDSPGMRAPVASGRDFRRLWRKLADTLSPPRLIAPNFWRCTVPQLPFTRIPGVAVANRVFGCWAVRQAIRAVGMQRYLSWFVVPHPGFMAHKLGEQLCVYYCIDDYAAHPGVDADAIARSDSELTASADQVFVAPLALLKSKQRQNPNTTFAPHGVDFDLFRRTLDRETEIPAVASALRGPVIGYFGLLADWIDFGLIIWLAKERPNWSFLLLGAEKTDIGELRSLPNVTLPGPQPYQTLPNWAKAFDVAIIPYRLNRQVLNANPLKLREYLATGRPVVTVRNPEIERYAEWVTIADDREQFLRGIEAALRPETADAVAARQQSVAASTWDARVAEVLKVVHEIYLRKFPLPC